jgi:hypothetical protein
MRYALRSKTQWSITVFSVRYMLRPNKEFNKTVLYEVRPEVEDTVEHNCFLLEFYAEAEETDECDCVLCGISAEVKKTLLSMTFLSEFYAEAEETDKCDCVLCELCAKVQDAVDNDCVLYEVRCESA